MELSVWKKRIIAYTGKYKYILLILMVGLLMMLMPAKTESDNATLPPKIEKEAELSEQLEQILSGISGAGKVKVMLSVLQGEEVLYQTDTTVTNKGENQDERIQTVLITDSQRNEIGLVYQKNPPVYRGAIILSEGADDPVVKLEIVDAVMKVTGLGANRISVLKMK